MAYWGCGAMKAGVKIGGWGYKGVGYTLSWDIPVRRMGGVMDTGDWRTWAVAVLVVVLLSCGR